MLMMMMKIGAPPRIMGCHTAATLPSVKEKNTNATSNLLLSSMFIRGAFKHSQSESQRPSFRALLKGGSSCSSPVRSTSTGGRLTGSLCRDSLSFLLPEVAPPLAARCGAPSMNEKELELLLLLVEEAAAAAVVDEEEEAVPDIVDTGREYCRGTEKGGCDGVARCEESRCGGGDGDRGVDSGAVFDGCAHRDDDVDDDDDEDAFARGAEDTGGVGASEEEEALKYGVIDAKRDADADADAAGDGWLPKAGVRSATAQTSRRGQRHQQKKPRWTTIDQPVTHRSGH